MTNATMTPKTANKTYEVTQDVTVTMVVQVDAPSAESAMYKAAEWCEFPFGDCEIDGHYCDDADDWIEDQSTLYWDIITVDPFSFENRSAVVVED